MRRGLLALALCALACGAIAKDQRDSPQAAARTYLQNYKDMALAVCVASAYRKDPDAAKDAGSSVSALEDWGYYDLERSAQDIRALVDRYLARNYANPLVEAEVPGIRFDFLKCLDMYHGKELAAQARRNVIRPNRTYRQDNPPPRQ